jgi:hypothetical protein
MFYQVQLFISGTSKKRPSYDRLKMISVDHLSTTLTGCVLVCSGLDNFLKGLAGLSNSNAQAVTGAKLMWERVRWAVWKDSKVAVILQDLQRHKLSLNLMLTIIQWFVNTYGCP